jgi:hypothetical protein
MTTLIPIDRATIRVNPHSGNSAFYIPLNPVVIEVKVFLRDNRWVREEWTGTGIKDRQLEHPILSRSHECDTAEKPEHWFSSITHTQPYDVLHTLSPEPRFLYEYQDVELTCKDCGARFRYFELEDGESFDGDELL